ncbi:tRNA threonylcarbamoyl adenosine modification protein (Sua5/YciO/YrdC/YwlC family) [Lipingzhangella halophila]|uniref:L-threonylcarbamoyladenylate synthase n=1 Tax=Lipingzhangella halophila TaxID=1783352 RepID=A0A7W7W5D7_9ACTN|nr:L-threonylcarbamoyladenylate synthase [Lipingzhangella halophila]MBB4933734.1 tRNA threonylcarbamoyl adenosine modification protein (Sua5/YciO/YrdC/YwlC family) [Lipingzhangella halophila]
MSRSYDCADDARRKEGIADAASAVRRGELVVLPTDTVYGIGTDAFNPGAVAGLLKAKGRGRDMPPPVLVGSVRAAQALVEDFGRHGRDLVDEFWPGPLTVVCAATPSLSWDLGDTKGTVAVRMPLQPVALDLLKEVGPTAVSSANVHGQPPATTAEDAAGQLGESVAVYLDGGPCESDIPSTIVDLTYAVPRLLRAGGIPIERLREVCGTVLGEPKRRAPRDSGAGSDSPEPESEDPGAAAENGDAAGNGDAPRDGAAAADPSRE